MHPNLYHGSGPNLSIDASRKTLLIGYCAFGANHKPYPGANVSMRVYKDKLDGSIKIEPAPWKEEAAV